MSDPTETHPGGPEAPRGTKGTLQEEIPKAEREHVQALRKRVETRREKKDYDRLYKDIRRWRTYVMGRQHESLEGDETKESLVRCNLIFSMIANAVPRIYSRNPKISIRPAPSVDETRYTAIKAFGRTAELVLNNQFSPANADLKSKAKSNVRSGMTTSQGWLKIVYQKDWDTDPLIEQRINDIQDHIKQVKLLTDDLKDPLKIEEHDRIRQELYAAVKALEQKPEVVVAQGLVIDRCLTENITVSDDITDPKDYVNAGWICEDIYRSRDWVKRAFGFAPDKATTFNSETKKIQESKANQSKADDIKDDDMLLIREFWHKTTNTVYTFCHGYDGYMRDPYVPTTGERFYCYFLLPFNIVDGEFIGLADTELLIELQDEYNETRSSLRQHRRWSIPHWVGLKGAVKESDVTSLRDAEPFEVVLIEGDEDRPLKQYLDVFDNPPLNPEIYDTTQTRVDIELVLGQGDAGQGQVRKTKTATEAEILQESLDARSSERMDEVEDLMADIARYSLELILQEMTPEQVTRIAGPGAVWPEMTKEEMFDMVTIEIEAGSTGRPNERKDQEIWMTLLPQVRETIMMIAEIRQNGGSEDMIEVMVKLLRETFLRFDERIDIDEFMPEQEQEEGPSQQEAMMMQQQLEEAQANLKLMKEQILETRTKSVKNLADAEAVEVGAQFDQYMKQVEFLSSILQGGQMAAQQGQPLQ